MLIYIVAILIGLVCASLLYVSNERQHYGKILTAVLFFIRAFVVAMLVLLFFNPYLKHKNNKIEQATIIIDT